MRIKKFPLIISIIFLFNIPLISILFIGGSASIHQNASGFVSPKVQSNVNLSDGQIELFWLNITEYQNISEFGNECYVKFANNGTHLFSLFVKGEDNYWLSIEFEPEPDVCMKNLNDGWVLYFNQNALQLAKDIHFIGTKRPSTDLINDISAESIFANGLIFTEMVRPFDTGDTDGYDITFYNGSLNMIQFASQKDHIGYHEDYFLFITDKLVGVDDIDPPAPENIPIGNNITLNQIKFILLGLTPTSVFIFIGFHIARRVYSSPIRNSSNRFVDSSFRPPTFKERWRRTFNSEE